MRIPFFNDYFVGEWLTCFKENQCLWKRFPKSDVENIFFLEIYMEFLLFIYFHEDTFKANSASTQ